MIVMDVVCRGGDTFQCSLVRLTGAIRHHWCRQQHWIMTDDHTRFPVVAGRFIVWLRLSDGLNSVHLTCSCIKCGLLSNCHLSLCLQNAVTGTEQMYMQPVLLLPTGKGSGTSDHIDILSTRISMGCGLIQAAVSDCLFRHFPDRPKRHFQLNNHILTCDIDKDTLLTLSSKDLWKYLSNTLFTRLGLSESRVKLWVFTLERDVKLGGEGLALFGSLSLTKWPLSLAELAGMVGDCARQFSLSLGGATHELCHVFGVGHAATGLMGRSYAGIGSYVLPSSVSIQHDPRSLLDTPSACILYHHRWLMVFPSSPPTSDISWDRDTSVLVSRHPIAVLVCQSAPPARLALLNHLPSSDTYRMDVGGWLADPGPQAGSKLTLPNLVMIHAQDIYGGILTFVCNTCATQPKA